MKRWLIWLAMLALWSAPQCRPVHADEAVLQPVALRIAALPAGVDPAAGTVTAGRLDASFQPLQHDALRFATGAARWYRLRLQADWRQPSAPLLVIHNARFQPVTLYAPGDYREQRQHHAQSGRDARFSRRALVFELPRDLTAAQSVYLRLPAATKNVPFTAQVYPEQPYQVADIGWVRVMMLFEAVQFTMLLVGLTLWLALREKLYGYFVGYLLPQFLYLLVSTGDLYLLPGSQWLEPLDIRLLWFVALMATQTPPLVATPKSPTLTAV